MPTWKAQKHGKDIVIFLLSALPGSITFYHTDILRYVSTFCLPAVAHSTTNLPSYLLNTSNLLLSTTSWGKEICSIIMCSERNCSLCFELWLTQAGCSGWNKMAAGTKTFHLCEKLDHPGMSAFVLPSFNFKCHRSMLCIITSDGTQFDALLWELFKMSNGDRHIIPVYHIKMESQFE